MSRWGKPARAATMSKYDKTAYWKLKSDPVKYAAYLERKRRERKAQQQTRGYSTTRKRKWRAANPEDAKRIRQANHAVEAALKSGKLHRLHHCEDCDKPCKAEAHHHKGYAQEHWLDVVWLCVFCHRKADADPKVLKIGLGE